VIPGDREQDSGSIRIEAVDHLVLTVADLDQTCRFYSRVLGMEVVRFGAGRLALRFGRQKINLHQSGREFEPKAGRPTPGSADLCFVTATALDRAVDHLSACGVLVEAGPVARTGAVGPVTSVYFRDPDDNLIELASYG
jgi:catechol 2,3-dioxygenase-like lactoylglutathione lyase family enzyme